MPRKMIYGEETVAISFKVPKSKKEEYKEKIREVLKGNIDDLTLLKNIIKKIIPKFIENGIDLEFSDLEFELIQKIREEIK